jgi:hypothetical protein
MTSQGDGLRSGTVSGVDDVFDQRKGLAERFSVAQVAFSSDGRGRRRRPNDVDDPDVGTRNERRFSARQRRR